MSTLSVHLSGNMTRFVDGEEKRFRDYAESKTRRIEKLTKGDTFHVRIGNEGKKVSVAVDVDGNERTTRTDITAFAAFDHAVDDLIVRLRKAKDKKVDKSGRVSMADIASTGHLRADRADEEDYYNEG